MHFFSALVIVTTQVLSQAGDVLSGVPDPPENLTLVSKSSRSVNISWSDGNNDTEDYKVHIKSQGKPVTDILCDHRDTQSSDGCNVTAKRVFIKGLNPFKEYQITVRARNDVGLSHESSQLNFTTNEEGPAKPPGNVRGHNVNSTSILVQWDDVPQTDQNGIIMGYRVKYKALPSGKERSKIGSERKVQTLEGLNEFTKYNICVLAFTVKGDGPMSCTDVMTAEDRPAKPPGNVRGHNVSSTSILVQWDDVPQTDQNGIIKGYRVNYKALPSGEETSKIGSERKETLENLNEFTNYSICVLAFTVKGDGPMNCTVEMTAQDKPAKPPSNIRAHNTSLTSILVQWDDVPQADQNGIIKGYRVKYKAFNTSEKQASINGAKHKEQNLEHLNKFTKYNICVLAFTVKGNGPKNCILLGTAQYRPAKPPADMQVHNTTSTSTLVKWNEVPLAEQNGIIEGYRVKYKVLNTTGELTETVNGSEKRELLLDELNEYTKYNICVLAFTVAGDGPMNCTVVTTAQDRPKKPPSNVRVHSGNISSTSILVQWDDVPQADQNGIIKGYWVKYKQVSNASRRESSKNLNESENKELLLDGLNEFTNYTICILAFTDKGNGSERCIIVATTEDKPAAPPDNVTGHNTSTKSILVQWDEVPEADQNGKIEGYRVVYRHLTNEQGNSTMVNDSTYRLELTKLEGSTKYNICVLAFTTKGDGPKGCVNVPTAEKARPKIKSCQERSDVLMTCNATLCTESIPTAVLWSFEDGKQFTAKDMYEEELWVKDVKQNNESQGIYTCTFKGHPEVFKELYLNVTEGPVNCTFYNGSWVCPNDTQSRPSSSPVSEEPPWEIIGPLLGSGSLGVAICAGWFLRRRFKNASAAKDAPEEPPEVPPQMRRRRPSDPWEVLEEDVFIQGFLGVGAFGEVWRAVVQHVGGIKGNRECAVKKLRGCVSSDTRKKFMKEIELMKKLAEQSHKNVVRFRGCVTRSETLMIIMEYTPYGDLLGFMRKSRGVADKHHTGEELHVRELTNYDLVRFAQQIACGMQYIKSRGILHRDLAARNVLVTTKFVCKITDFGMAFQTERYGYGAAKRGRIPIKWTAPEVLFETSTFQVSSKSDVWSYGILLYEIFTLGGTPYDGFREADVMAHLQNKQYRMPQPSHVSESIYAIMVQCWSEDPDDRPTFEELNTIFLDCITGEYYVEVLNMEKYESELYQPERFVSDGDNLAERTSSLQTETKIRFASETNLRTDEANILSTAAKGFVSESDLSVRNITFAYPVEKKPEQTVPDSNLSIDSPNSLENAVI